MTIDVINYTDAQLAALSEEQLLEVKSVQQQKNKLTVKLAEKKREEKFRLLEAGTFRSAIYQKLCEALDEEYEREVEALHDGLTFYLRFTAVSDESVAYTVDYSLDYAKRYEIVKAYYDGTYANAVEKFAAFKRDTVATKYLGEVYAPLYNLYASAAEG